MKRVMIIIKQKAVWLLKVLQKFELAAFFDECWRIEYYAEKKGT